MDDAVWDHAVFSKSRDRLLTSDVARVHLEQTRQTSKSLGKARQMIRRPDLSNLIPFTL
jgi:hypothetical protein